MAAVFYWAGIFALGFVLGTVRTIWLAPLIGAEAAVACELPVMLAASWFLARRIVSKYRIGPGLPAVRMGLSAFALLMISELLVGVTLFGQSPRQWLASLGTPEGALGLCGQLAFAAIPWALTRGRS